MSDDLKSCPFCGSYDLGSGGDDKVVGYWCKRCEATGPNHYGRYEWNSRADRIEELEAKLEKAMRYFDEAMYFIDLDEEDILKGAGVYRIAKAYAELGAVIPAEWDAAIKHVAELKGQDDG